MFDYEYKKNFLDEMYGKIDIKTLKVLLNDLLIEYNEKINDLEIDIDRMEVHRVEPFLRLEKYKNIKKYILDTISELEVKDRLYNSYKNNYVIDASNGQVKKKTPDYTVVNISSHDTNITGTTKKYDTKNIIHKHLIHKTHLVYPSYVSENIYFIDDSRPRIYEVLDNLDFDSLSFDPSNVKWFLNHFGFCFEIEGKELNDYTPIQQQNIIIDIYFEIYLSVHLDVDMDIIVNNGNITQKEQEKMKYIDITRKLIDRYHYKYRRR